MPAIDYVRLSANLQAIYNLFKRRVVDYNLTHPDYTAITFKSRGDGDFDVSLNVNGDFEVLKDYLNDQDFCQYVKFLMRLLKIPSVALVYHVTEDWLGFTTSGENLNKNYPLLIYRGV